MADMEYEDMGYGDMGYGHAEPDLDYGYGDAEPDSPEDYGYGDAEPDPPEDYGYGDAEPDPPEDYGYGDAAPDDPTPLPEEKKRPKRRCSVTKFSLEEAEGPQSGLMAADVIKNFRNGAVPAPEPAPVVVDDCNKSFSTEETRSMDSVAAISPEQKKQPKAKGTVRKKGMMSRIRKRLSIAM